MWVLEPVTKREVFNESWSTKSEGRTEAGEAPRYARLKNIIFEYIAMV